MELYDLEFNGLVDLFTRIKQNKISPDKLQEKADIWIELLDDIEIR